MGDDGDVKGTFELHARQQDPNRRVHGEVICVTLIGNQAWLGGRMTQSDHPAAPPGTFSLWRVVDNGEGTGAPPDQISLRGVGLPNPTIPYCTNHPNSPALFPIAAVNIQIH